MQTIRVPSTPCSLGKGFEKFTEWRPGQEEALAQFLESDKKYLIYESPTGAGKTLTSFSYHRLLNEYKTVYSCTTKKLQDQVKDDFPFSVELKGRANYDCLIQKGLHADDCVEVNNRCKGCETPTTFKQCPYHKGRHVCYYCRERDRCPYRVQKQKALNAEVAVLNTMYFLLEANYVGGFSERSLLILDEADCLEELIVNFAKVALTDYYICQHELPKPNYYADSKAYWHRWLLECEAFILERLASRWDKEDLKALNKIHQLNDCLDDDWIIIPEKLKTTFSPVMVDKLAERFVFRHFDKVIMMSATICNFDAFMRNYGITQCGALCISQGSNIPIENRMNLYEPIVPMSQKVREKNLERMVRSIDKHLDGCKTMISVTTTKNAYEVARLSEHEMSVYTAEQPEVLDAFKKGEVSVIVSPSLRRGYDFPYDECRKIIIAKIPFPYIGDERVKARMATDKEWYYWTTIRELIQTSGRAARAPDDFSECYILDASFGKLLREHRRLFPKWWLNAGKKLARS